MKRAVFVHEAVLRVEGDFDDGAPGAAVTTSLCGHWKHEGACTWPHYTGVSFEGELLHLRTLFACVEADESTVRSRIVRALAYGRFNSEDGVANHWSLIQARAGEVLPDEVEHGYRLAALADGPVS